MNRKKFYDLLERAVWTAIQAILGVLTADALGIPKEYGALFATALSMAKSAVAGQLGNKESVSTLPAELDPATR